MDGNTLDKARFLAKIRNNPQKYSREDAYEYICQGIFSKEELVDIYGVLTPSALNRILFYPHIKDEQTPLPLPPLNIDEQIIIGDVDVLFWGVCGSGGKTSLLGSLMTLVGRSNFFVYRHNSINKNIYGHYLSDYLNDNRILPRTDSMYIQIVNTLLQTNETRNGVSFVEFAGEQVAAAAGNNVNEGLRGGGLGTDLIKILTNKNKKILFFCFDPTISQNLQIETDDSFQWITQPDLLSCVVSLMQKDSMFMKDVIAIHLIITKSDVWLNQSLERSLTNVIEDGICGGLFLQVEKLAIDYGINKHLNNKVEPIPFSIGKFMMGDTYEFDNSDAKKVLRLIEEDIAAYNKNKSKLKKFGLKFNQFFNS